MSFAYFDTSAVAKRYILEPGSLQVRGLLRRHDFLSSAITPLEILSALGTPTQTGKLSEKNFTAAVRRVGSDRTRWELIKLGAVVLNRAEEIIQQGPMIGVGRACGSPSLRTVQAGLPHTALRSVVHLVKDWPTALKRG